MRREWLFYAFWGTLAIACFSAAILMAAPAHAEWKGRVPLNTQIDQANFSVNGSCSGTLISLDQRWILTANHCTESQYETVTVEDVLPDGEVVEKKIRRAVPGYVEQITFADGMSIKTVRYRTVVVRSDKEKDLALLQITSPIANLTAAKIACQAPMRGEDVYIVGNPQGLYASVVKGMVSSDERTYDSIHLGDDGNRDNRLMQISGGVIPGNSGGAVYNAAGELVGVPVLAHRTLETLGFAVPITEIHAFFCKAQRPGNCALSGGPDMTDSLDGISRTRV